MAVLRDLLDRKWVLIAIGVILGILVGILYAWVLSPVVVVDATTAQLRPELRVDILRMAIDSYSVNRDADLAMERYRALGAAGQDTLRQLAASPGEVSPTALQSFNALVEILQSATPVASGATPAAAGGVVSTARGAAATASKLILPVCGVTFLLGLALVGVLFLRNRSGTRTPRRQAVVGAEPAAQPTKSEPSAATAATQTQDPLATFRTIYTLGDDLYDDSFSIESAAGDFLGECGVGIGDLVGVGDPKKVSAFEVWLFDKNDIQTVTKVLMSRYAYNDEATRTKLAAKGDPELAVNGAVVNLQTASLEVEARIVDMKYGEGPLPQESFFERMTIELRAWPRGSQARH
jgi:hypothetical protein